MTRSEREGPPTLIEEKFVGDVEESAVDVSGSAEPVADLGDESDPGDADGAEQPDEPFEDPAPWKRKPDDVHTTIVEPDTLQLAGTGAPTAAPSPIDDRNQSVASAIVHTPFDTLGNGFVLVHGHLLLPARWSAEGEPPAWGSDVLVKIPADLSVLTVPVLIHGTGARPGGGAA